METKTNQIRTISSLILWKNKTKMIIKMSEVNKIQFAFNVLFIRAA